MKLSKVLIANRGEIAVRLIRACDKLNIKSVAVYSDADADALHVQMADEAVRIGAPQARVSYLEVEKIIAAAQRVGADAIHPGYGFLSENADFARRCAQVGVIFVGPHAEAIASMGAKIQAKRLAEQAGVHCVPGYHGDDQSDATLLAEAKRIGPPLLIKASAGGGGRGMRRIDRLDDFAASLTLARGEAGAAFGDASLLLEKYVEAPRHIEVQILADRHGHVRHLFERDCSVQRNYQKVIEEAPAPNLAPELRSKILDDAVKLACAIGYDNAGTVEFVVDARKQAAYFLEMNTRLQVEHPVTEMITGIDLAEWQLRIAAGEAIDFEQEDVVSRGHAVEARVTAENPAEGYRPETGTVTEYREPGLSQLRIDSGVGQGSEVSPYYDSLLAKMIGYGHGRDEAIHRLQQGLAGYRIAGVGTNIAFLHEVLALPTFKAGKHLTGLLAVSYPKGWSAQSLDDFDLAHAALAWHIQVESSGPSNAWSNLGAWRLGEHVGHAGTASYWLRRQGDEARFFQVVGRSGRYRVTTTEGTLLDVEKARYTGEVLSYHHDDKRAHLTVLASHKKVSVQKGATTHDIEVLLAEDVLLTEGQETSSGGNQVLAPTPGLVSQVLVAKGDPVSAGQPVAVLEAMKLYRQLLSPVDGVVAQIHCANGDSVNGGDVLISFATDHENSQ